MTIPVVIFGGIGAVVETSELQRLAYNDAFAAADIDFQWDSESYRSSLTSSGGKERLRSLRLPSGKTLTEDQIGQVHALKTQTYNDRLAHTTLPLRAGVAHLLEQAEREAVTLIWATTTLRENIDAIFAATPPALNRDAFTYVACDADVVRQKPDPEIYETLIERFKLDRDTTVVIEDSPSGVRSAAAAGLKIAAFPGELTQGLAFGEAEATIASAEEAIPIIGSFS